MRRIKSVLSRSVLMVVAMSVICGVFFPLVITGSSQFCFKDKSNGSVIEREGIIYGSELLAQEFTDNGYLWGRVMSANTGAFVDDKGNPLYYFGPSNLTPASEDYQALIAERVKKIKASNPEKADKKVPVELVTGSGSGLDPHISVNAATYQIPRIAEARGISSDEVETIIKKYTTKRLVGILGEEVVNVLKVNLALDGKI